MPSMRNLMATAPLLLLFASASCAKQKGKEAGDGKPAASASAQARDLESGLQWKPDQEQQAALDALVQKLNRNNWRFPSQESNEPRNARLFTYLAATSDDPAVIGGALSAMYGAYSSHSKRKAQPDADFVQAVQRHLGASDPKLAVRALLAARTAMAGRDANAELIDRVTKLARQDPYQGGPGRHAIIDSLRVVSAAKRTPEVVAIFAESLEAKEPYVLSYALQALYRSVRSVENKDAIKAKAVALAAHEDAGVRGRAVELLGAFGRDDQAVLDLVLGALSDPSPYVRSEAAEAVARLRYVPAIHALIKLVDDKESNRHDIRNWTTLDGKPGRLHHDGSPWGRVYDAAMNGIRSLSEGQLSLERINPKQIEAGLDENAAATKAWYAKEKAKIPKLGTPLAALRDSKPSGPRPSASGASARGTTTSAPKSSAP